MESRAVAEFAEYLTREEAAALLRRTPAVLAGWAYRRTGPPFIRTGGRVLYRTADLELWLEAHRITPEAER
jgi:helix-turn-helix protein